MSAAKRIDWQTRPFPLAVKELAFQKNFTQEEMAQIALGLIPKAMEDKWFIYYDDNTLNFHRSWTGHLIYQLTFSEANEQFDVVRVVVNRDSSEYNQQDDTYDIKLLSFLIDRLLLNKNVAFPTHDAIEQEKQALYRHSMIGHGRSNKEE